MITYAWHTKLCSYISLIGTSVLDWATSKLASCPVISSSAWGMIRLSVSGSTFSSNTAETSNTMVVSALTPVEGWHPYNM